MTNNEINRAVAMELGWADIVFRGIQEPKASDYTGRHQSCTPKGSTGIWSGRVPDFCTEHSAAAEMRQFVMQQPCIDKYITALADVMLVDHYSLSRAEVWAMIAATPREQAEAFLRMRGKWVEKEKV